ncbi:uncharacterized protein LOC124302722 [Neodiprion virginianus]|uniref:uncharacterized protein LOC124302722 n=1 Tax=Neodiprion virginianus TaxID=2961670 RepID=UPI001EE70BF0|nr:uncharacterized protein LOC124302722 [Neodiprion virginianus]
MSQPKEEHDLEPAREMFTMTIVNDALPSDIANANKESKQPSDFEAAIEATEYGLYNYLLLVAIFPAGWANVFDTTTISYILPSAECDLHLSLNEKGALNAIIYSGMITSAFLWGFLADTKGRRSLLIFGYLADSICNILSSMSQNFLTMLVFKFFSGFVISGPLAISTTYLAEFHSTKYRSATLFWTALFSAMGNVAMPALAWAIIPQSWTLTFFDGAFVFNSWRIFIFVCSMPAFVAFAALLYFPESPKYLMTQGRNDEAMAVFQRMYAMNTGNPPELFPIKSLSLEGQKKKIEPSAGRTTVSVWQNVRGGFGQIRPLFVKPYLGQFLLILALQFGSILSLNTVRLWMPQLLTLMETYDYESHDSATLCDMISVPSVSNATSYDGFNSTTTIDDCLVPFVPSKVYINSMIISATTVLGFVVAGTLVNLMGKKNLLLLAFALPAVGIFGLNWSPSSNITLGIIAIYIALTSLSTTTIITFCVDLMPTSLRTMAVGLTMSIGRSGAMIGNVVFPILLVTGCFAPFIFVGGFLIFCFVLTIFVPKPPAKLLFLSNKMSSINCVSCKISAAIMTSHISNIMVYLVQFLPTGLCVEYLPPYLAQFNWDKMTEKNEGTKRCQSEKVQEVFTISFHTEESQPASVIVPDESESPRDFEEAIEATGYGLYNVLLLLAALPGAWANLFDTTAISYVLPTADCDLEMTLFQKGLLNAAIYAGMFTAAFPWGVLADTKGRKTLLMIGYFADCICNVLSSMSQSFYVMLAFKFFSGCIMSGPFAVNMTYLAEFHGVKYRSKMLLWARLFPSLGSIVLPGLAWMILPQSWSFSLFDGVFVYNSWRIFILICSLPAFLGFLALIFFPESPRFLMSQGRNDEAMNVFKKMYSMNTGKPPETFPVKELYLEAQKKQVERTSIKSSVSVWEKTRSGWSQIKPLFHKPYLSQFVLMTTIQFGGLLGMNTLRLWMPQLFTLMENFNYENRDASLGPATLCEMLTSPEPLNTTDSDEWNSTIVNACVAVPIHSRVYINSIIIAVTTVLGCTLAGSLVNLVGKKNLLLLVYVAPAACSFSLNWSPNSNVTLAIFSIYLMFTSIAVTSIISFTVDLMPTSLRATAVSLTMSIGRIGSMIGNLLFPLLLSTGCMVPFIFVGGFLLVCFVLSIFIPKPPEKLM